MSADARKDEDGLPNWTDVTGGLPDEAYDTGGCPACGSALLTLVKGTELLKCAECGEIFDEDDGEATWDAYGHHRTRLRESDQ